MIVFLHFEVVQYSGSSLLWSCRFFNLIISAIQHDRDKIRYTKRAKKIKEEEAMDVTEITSGKSVFLKEEAESPPSTQYALFYSVFIFFFYENNFQFSSRHDLKELPNFQGFRFRGNDDVANLSSPSSSAGQAPASNDSGSGTGVDEKATTNNGTLQGPAIPGIDVPEPPPSTEIKNIKVFAGSCVTLVTTALMNSLNDLIIIL